MSTAGDGFVTPIVTIKAQAVTDIASLAVVSDYVQNFIPLTRSISESVREEKVFR
jgi:hypothetical protein